MLYSFIALRCLFKHIDFLFWCCGSLHSLENQAVRTAHFLRWRKIMSVLLIVLLPILMGMNPSFLLASASLFLAEGFSVLFLHELSVLFLNIESVTG